MRSRFASWIISLTLAAAFWSLATPAAAHPVVDVANPRPNDRVIAGSLVMRGVAYDHDSTLGAGVDSFTVRICGQGGQHLGEAVLGLPSTMSIDKGDARCATAGWQVTVLLKGAGDLRELCVTARSSVTGTQTLVRVPITIGSKPPAPPAADAATEEDSGPSATPTPPASATPIPGTSPPTPVPSSTPIVGQPATPTPTPVVLPSPTPTPDPEEVGPD